MTDIRTVGIVGAGTIGASWAAFYALHGMEVRAFDDDADTAAAAPGIARSHLRRMAELGLADADACDRARVTAAGSIEEACDGADFAHESISETYEAKRPVFAKLDALTEPSCMLASSSSGLLMTEIQAGMQHPERAFISHPFNPPHIVPLVELVGGEQTSPEVLERAREFYASLGKEPVTLNKETPGHIANRLAAALWREAIDLVDQGVASVADVDTALRAGPGIRWAIMGQHMIYHLGGGKGGYRHFIDHIGKAFGEYWRTMPAWAEIPDGAKEAIIEGVEEAAAGRSLAAIAAERDEKLAAILRALRG